MAVNWKETKQFKKYWNKGLDSLDLFKNSINRVELLNSNKFLFLPTDVCLLLHTDDLESGTLFIFFPLKLLLTKESWQDAHPHLQVVLPFTDNQTWDG